MEQTDPKAPKDWFARILALVAVLATLASALIHARSMREVGELTSRTAERVARLDENRELIRRADDRWKMIWQERQSALDDLWHLGIFEEQRAADLFHRTDYVATAIVPKLERARSVFPDSTSPLIDDFLISFRCLGESPQQYRKVRQELLRALREATRLKEPRSEFTKAPDQLSAPDTAPTQRSGGR